MEIRGRLLVRNTALNFIGLVIVALVALVSIPFIIRGLGVEAFGIYSLALVVLGGFSFFDLGLGRATTKFAAERLGGDQENALSGVVWTSLGVQFLLGTVGAIVFVVAIPVLVGDVFKIPSVLVGEAKATFLILAASLPIVLGAGPLRGTLEAAQRFDLVNAVKIPASASTYLIPAIGVSFGARLPVIAIALVVARLVAIVAYLLLCCSLLPCLREKLSFDSKLLRRLMIYGSWVTVSNVASPILVYLDRILIASLISMSAVAYYTAPYELATALWVLPTSLAATLFPAFSTLGASTDRQGLEELQDLYTRSLKAILLTLGPLTLLVVFFAQGILQLWLGTRFVEQSTMVLQILAIGVLINSLSWIPFSFLQGLGRADLTAKLHLLELLFYPGLAWFLIMRLGITGAALAWTLRVIVDAVVLFVAGRWLQLVSLRIRTESGLLSGY